MKNGWIKLLQAGALAAVMALPASAATAGTAVATVTYAEPDRFTDVPFTPWERERVLKQLTAHFDKLAASLPPGQEFKVEVLDLDLAGQTKPNFRGGQDLRVMNGGADWPHIHLRYSISEGGKVLKSGEEKLSNMQYLHRMNSYGNNELLRYEKQMLDDWFKQTVAARSATR
ncbi:DUF3016 domain-containing protein [Massilia pseudoviolaceinigra]|uniref:DUF3016 domain-containing protein n=1 Tax=Massilia pseudoviolaceinigra TaxID=3057165 RepID=UPI0027968972|nr:DUF3016 domain-containing protein [Massilia sp. CCM 9206]MDQ1924871.1 DUF3016 domain-containing protein [Massilia sp. CCM 9206]